MLTELLEELTLTEQSWEELWLGNPIKTNSDRAIKAFFMASVFALIYQIDLRIERLKRDMQENEGRLTHLCPRGYHELR